MQLFISPIERMVLESLSKSKKDFLSLNEDTKLEALVLQNILKDLISKNIICLQDTYYKVNEALPNQVIEQLKDQKSVLAEVSQILKTTMKDHNKIDGCRFKFKKIYMDNEEEQIFKSLLLQVEGFLEGLDKKRGKTCEQKVIFWGVNNYENISSSLLSNN